MRVAGLEHAQVLSGLADVSARQQKVPASALALQHTHALLLITSSCCIDGSVTHCKVAAGLLLILLLMPASCAGTAPPVVVGSHTLACPGGICCHCVVISLDRCVLLAVGSSRC